MLNKMYKLQHIAVGHAMIWKIKYTSSRFNRVQISENETSNLISWQDGRISVLFLSLMTRDRFCFVGEGFVFVGSPPSAYIRVKQSSKFQLCLTYLRSHLRQNTQANGISGHWKQHGTAIKLTLAEFTIPERSIKTST